MRIKLLSNVKGLTGILWCLFFITGCVSAGEHAAYEGVAVVRHDNGTYHKVQKGETLWRIAKMYGVSIEAIIAANNIPNVGYIEVNQLLFIPGASKVQPETPPSEASEAVPVDSDPDSFIWPLKGRVITYFGERSHGQTQKGIAIAADEGQKVVAARTGRVAFADYLPGYGDTVILDHLDGYYSVYSRNRKLLVHLGETVHKGMSIAEVGRVGDAAFLHFEIRRNDQSSNPLYYLPKN